MADIFTTLHLENNKKDNLYPNIRKENIPKRIIDESYLTETLLNLINSGKSGSPSYVNTEVNILSLNENKGLAVATDTGYWYYWNGTKYVQGAIYQATQEKPPVYIEIPLTVDSNGFYDLSSNGENVTPNLVTHSSKNSTYTANKGLYLLNCYPAGSRKVFILYDNKLIGNVYYNVDSEKYIPIYIPYDNCVIYMSSLNSFDINLYKFNSSYDLINNIIEGLGFNVIKSNELNVAYYENKFVDINNNTLLIVNNNNFNYSRLLVNKGKYLVKTRLSGSAKILLFNSNRIINSISLEGEYAGVIHKYYIDVPEDNSILYISNRYGSDIHCSRIFKIDDNYNVANVYKLDNVLLKSGGYYQESINLKTGSGFYYERIDISPYEKIKIIFDSVSTTSDRRTIITDVDNNILMFDTDRNRSYQEFNLNELCKYAYISSIHSKMDVELYLHDNKEINPLSNTDDIGYDVTLFNKITCIGDSLTEGVFNTTGSDVVIKNYSYPSYLKKLTGVETVNLGIGSMCASRLNTGYSWLDVANSRDYLKAENIGDAVIIALGTNDIIRYDSFTGSIENPDDNTSVGGYIDIINTIRNLKPNVKIFCVTIPHSRNTEEERNIANPKIRQIAELLGCYIIDLDLYSFTSDTDNFMFINIYKNGSHNNAIGYFTRAKQYASAISYIIKTHLSEFTKIQFIGTNYNY